jgi:hypothetical protein
MSALILAAMIMIESGGNPNAIGKYGEVGIVQIQPIVIRDVNRFYRTSYVFPRDARSKQKSIEILQLYIKLQERRWIERYGRKATLHEKLAFWNGGPNGPKKENARRYAREVLKKARELDQNRNQK